MSDTNRPARTGIDRDQIQSEWRRRRDHTDHEPRDSGDGRDPVDDTSADATGAPDATNGQSDAVTEANQSGAPDVLLDDITSLDTPVIAEDRTAPVDAATTSDVVDEPATQALSGRVSPGGTVEFDDQPLLWDVFEAVEDLAEAAGELFDAAGNKIGEVVDAGMGSIWDGGESSGDEGDDGDDSGDDGGDTVSGGDLEGPGGGGTISGQQALPPETFEPIVEIDLSEMGYDSVAGAAGIDDSIDPIDDTIDLDGDLGGGL